MSLLLLSCAVIMLASLSGKLFAWRVLGAFIERNLHFLVTFAAGVFLVIAWQLGAEVLEHMEILPSILWMLGGAVVVTLACKWLPHGEVAHEEGHRHNHSHLDAHRMVASDSLHNVGDGILLAAAFAASPLFGIAASVSVFLHEVVQEIAEFFVLKDAGYSTRRALLLNFATSATILIGAVGGWVLLELFEALETPLLAIATGGVLSVVLYDLLPHSVRDANTRSLRRKHIVWFLVGAILMYGVTTLVPHAHPEQSGEPQEEVSV